MLPLVVRLGGVVLHTFVIYLFIIFFLSLLDRRQTAALSLTELTVLMMIGSSVETAMVAGDVSLFAGLVSAGTLFLSDRGMSFLMEHWKWLRDVIVGEPIPLIYKGKYLEKNIDSAGLTHNDVMEGIREKGYDSPQEVRLAVFEIDGTISVVPFSEKDEKKRKEKAQGQSENQTDNKG